ncbi:MAG: hypothetical protein FJ387_22105 [Verrucomicrobia bacterium]|nr:hypothetical protein [Verrucomicrobiota bacterium]
MATSKVDRSGVFEPVTVEAHKTRLLLSAKEVVVRPNGLEFLSPHPIALWTEVTVDLRSPVDARPVRGGGVVVDCTGNRHAGYVVSLVLMNLTRQSQERLRELAVCRHPAAD